MSHKYTKKPQQTIYVIPLFHHKIKPRPCLGPLILWNLEKMGGASESVCRPGIKYKSSPGGPRQSGIKPRLRAD